MTGPMLGAARTGSLSKRVLHGVLPPGKLWRFALTDMVNLAIDDLAGARRQKRSGAAFCLIPDRRRGWASKTRKSVRVPRSPKDADLFAAAS